uniref:Putative DNA primase n=1 Tax=viral metagenome TaxID=1070528 RepID=A0A6M3IKT2_9ZZZZ
MFDAEQFLDDHGVSYSRGGKHGKTGWIQIACPMCTGNPGWHGGFNVEEGYYHCRRCAWHPIDKIVATLLNVELYEARRIVKPYFINQEGDTRAIIPRKQVIELPAGLNLMRWPHKEYLKGRGFDPEEIYNQWGVMGTGHIGDYKYRLFIPITYKGECVSYTTRDITGRSQLKYLSCLGFDEVVPHQDLLYGFDQAQARKVTKVAVVEGPTDVWRLGVGALGTFGIDWTKAQLRLLVENFEQFVVMYDREVKAQEKAEDLVNALVMLGREAYNVKIKVPDPAKFTDEEAMEIMRGL